MIATVVLLSRVSTAEAQTAEGPPPANMTAVYEPALTTARPVRYGRFNGNVRQGLFEQETLFVWSARREKPNSEGEQAEPEKEDRLTSDRPDFTEASSTVGRGRVQLESGYTYFGDRAGGTRTHTHSYPEALLRIGLFADWFELRLGQTVFTQTTRNGTVRVTNTGATDLYLGVKLALTKQEGVLPETALILQGTVPTGSSALTADRVLFGANYLFSWEINDFLSLAGSLQGNKAIDDTGREYAMLSQSLSVGYTLTKNLTAYTEWFAFYPTLATATGGGAQHFLDGGFQYFVTKNFALDIRAGVGLSRSADDFFTGAGFVVRY